MAILAVQSVTVLLLSVGIELSFGVIIALMILIVYPLVTSLAILKIVGRLSAALISVFVLSLWPARRFVNKPILKIIS